MKINEIKMKKVQNHCEKNYEEVIKISHGFHKKFKRIYENKNVQTAECGVPQKGGRMAVKRRNLVKEEESMSLGTEAMLSGIIGVFAVMIFLQVMVYVGSAIAKAVEAKQAAAAAKAAEKKEREARRQKRLAAQGK